MMKSGADPKVFLLLAQSADDRMGGQIQDWVNTWWRAGNGDAWCGADLTLMSPEDWFDLKNVPGPRLWIPPPAAMGAVVEMFSKDRLVRPHLPHVFVVPRLMTHLWRKQLSKDADVVLTIPVGQSFWPANMHEPLLLVIVLPLTHVSNYRGPWLVKSTDAPSALEERLKRCFAAWGESEDDSEELHELEGYVPGLWRSKEEWLWTVLHKFLAEQRKFPPVHECVVRGMLRRKPKGPLPSSLVKVRPKKRMV
jgi:hypothetical protein